MLYSRAFHFVAATLLLLLTNSSADSNLRSETTHHDSNTAKEPSKHENNFVRELQDVELLPFRQTYVAQFMELRSSLCEGEKPVIRVYCRNTMELLETSDPSIECTQLAETSENGWTTAECVTTCADDTACADVYLLRSGAIRDGPFGNITFQCSGDEVRQVDGAMSYLDSGAGRCATDTTTQIFHLARLGMSCPTDTGDREIVFDDFFSECDSNLVSNFPTDGDLLGNEYTCYDGRNCQGSSCSVDFDQFFIDAEVPNFLECIEADTAVTAAPAPDPGVPTEISVGLEAQFRGWYSRDVSDNCAGDSPTFRATCENGIIKLINTTSATITCEKPNDRMLECIDSGTTFAGRFAGIVYNCTSETLPQSSIELLAGEVFCSGNALPATVSHQLQMAVACNLAAGRSFYSQDLYFDCSDRSHQYGNLDENGDAGNSFSCAETVTFPRSSTENNPRTVPFLSMMTDSDWSPDDAFEGCYTLFSDNRIPTNAPTLSPTLAPLTDSPTRAPTMTPTSAPMNALTTNSPTLSPSKTPAGLTPAPGTGSVLTPAPGQKDKGLPTPGAAPVVEESSSSIGVVVGGAVGGVFIVCLAVFLAVWIRAKNRKGAKASNSNAAANANGTGVPPTDSGGGGDQRGQPNRAAAAGGGYPANAPYRPSGEAEYAAAAAGAGHRHRSDDDTYQNTSATPYRYTDQSGSHQNHDARAQNAASSPYRYPAAASATSSQTDYTQSSANSRYNPSFKDQSQTVINPEVVPVVDAVAMDNPPPQQQRPAQPSYNYPAGRVPTMEATPVMDTAINSQGSGSTRRTAEPQGRYAVDP